MLKFLGFVFVSAFIFLYLHFSQTSNWWPDRDTIGPIVYFFCCSLFAFFPIEFILKKMNKSLPWSRHVFLRFICELIIIWGSLNLFVYVAFQVFSSFLSTATQIQIDTLALKYEILIIIFSVIYALVNFYNITQKKYSSAEIEIEKLTHKRLNLQYELLKSQLSPHYLFNTLNTISALIYRGPETTNQFIRKFAETLDYIMLQNDKILVSLKEELKFLDSFLFLLKIRYEDAVIVKNSIYGETETIFIPPLSLQILIENAVKHNKATDSKPLEIAISKNKKHISVSNPKSPVSVQNIANNTTESFKIGLENVKKRYAFFTKKNIIINDKENFEVKLPILSPEDIKENFHLLSVKNNCKKINL